MWNEPQAKWTTQNTFLVGFFFFFLINGIIFWNPINVKDLWCYLYATFGVYVFVCDGLKMSQHIYQINNELISSTKLDEDDSGNFEVFVTLVSP